MLGRTRNGRDMLFQFIIPLAQLAHEELHLVQRSRGRLDRGRSRPVRKHVRGRVVLVRDEADEHVAAVVLDLAVGELLLDGNAGDAADVRKRVVDVRIGADAVLSGRLGDIAVTERSGRDLGRHFGEADAHRSDLVPENLATVQSLPSRHRVIEPLEIDKLCGGGRRSVTVEVEVTRLRKPRETHSA